MTKAVEPDPYWNAENRQFPVQDWKDAVVNGDTRQGYWEWVEAKIEAEEACDAAMES